MTVDASSVSGDAGRQQAPPTPSPTSSPLRSSPLASNPPIFSAFDAATPTQARPIPRRVSQPTRSRASINMPPAPAPAPGSSSSSPSHTLSRSHPLLGSYPLSLIHSRMSHAHQPHSSMTTFSLHIKAVGQGKRCPAELRCPKALDLPFPATYYDLQDSSAAAASQKQTQTPWVGTVDLEQYFYDQYSPASSSSAGSSAGAKAVEPPGHPGYHVAPVGQLQMIVKTPTNAIRAFMVPYDLRALPVGGRLLARERTYVETTPSSPSSPTDKGKRKESLRYAYQLQFLCLPATSAPRGGAGTSASSTTRHTTLIDDDEACERSYYLSKTLKVVFTSTPPEPDEHLRTERTDEIVPCSVGIRVSNTVKQRRRSSASGGVMVLESPSPGRTVEDWEMVRKKWLARRDMHLDNGSNPDGSALIEEQEATHPPDHSVSVSVSGWEESGREEELLPPFKPPTRAPTPVPQPFTLPSQHNGPSAHVQPVKPPPSPRFARRQLRRTSAEERQLSEQLRQMGLQAPA